MTEDPFARFEADLDERSASDDTVTLRVPDRAALPDDEARLRFVAYAGLFDLLAEAMEEAFPSEEDRTRRLAQVQAKMEGALPTLRFWLYEKKRQAESEELVARMRGRDIAMTREWMLPRLEEDIAAYRERISALRRAIEEKEA